MSLWSRAFNPMQRNEQEVPKSVAARAAENAKDAFEHARMQKESSMPISLDDPEILHDSKPLFFEIRPSRVGLVEVFYSRRESFSPKRALGEMRHEDLGSTLLKLLANVQPPEIDIYNGIDGGGDDE
ncbi:hypothetical protein [Burkholderia sp. Ac-20353]|uniref:hypothetical protein n=1 Tax=Burkholderia sp. Ac-20353 TaxID=2703894 RepID=UPI00197C8DD2|nr:hypothetical protein [Burkholderia sp. Ac-20353]MBN3788296.1 hypothetical protein [Burkholderia sp. Ac-20353]